MTMLKVLPMSPPAALPGPLLPQWEAMGGEGEDAASAACPAAANGSLSPPELRSQLPGDHPYCSALFYASNGFVQSLVLRVIKFKFLRFRWGRLRLRF